MANATAVDVPKLSQSIRSKFGEPSSGGGGRSTAELSGVRPSSGATNSAGSGGVLNSGSCADSSVAAAEDGRTPASINAASAAATWLNSVLQLAQRTPASSFSSPHCEQIFIAGHKTLHLIDTGERRFCITA